MGRLLWYTRFASRVFSKLVVYKDQKSTLGDEREKSNDARILRNNLTAPGSESQT